MAGAQAAEERRLELAKNNSAARIQTLERALTQEAEAQINATGEAYLANLEVTLGPDGASTQQAAAFQHTVTQMESQAVASEQASFQALVSHEQALVVAVQQQVVAYGNAAAVNATRTQSAAAVARFGVSARNLTDQYYKAAKDWEAAQLASGSAASSTYGGWAASYRNVTAAYAAVTASLTDVNDAQKSSTVAGRELRWGQQSSRLAGDMSEIVNGRTELSSLEAETAAQNAQQAASMVASNTAIVPVVQDLVNAAVAEANAAQENVAFANREVR